MARRKTNSDAKIRIGMEMSRRRPVNRRTPTTAPGLRRGPDPPQWLVEGRTLEGRVVVHVHVLGVVDEDRRLLEQRERVHLGPQLGVGLVVEAGLLRRIQGAVRLG